MTDEREGGGTSPVQGEEQLQRLQKIACALRAWHDGLPTDRLLSSMKLVCVGGGGFCCLASLFMSGSVGFRVLWALYLIQLVATLALYLFRRRHPIPRHWEDVIAADLERYVPVNINAFRWLQERVDDTGQIIPTVLAQWLEAESLAAGRVSPPKKSWAFTAREFPVHLAEEGRDERGEKP